MFLSDIFRNLWILTIYNGQSRTCRSDSIPLCDLSYQWVLEDRLSLNLVLERTDLIHYTPNLSRKAFEESSHLIHKHYTATE
jgi:hypothetical protein